MDAHYLRGYSSASGIAYQSATVCDGRLTSAAPNQLAVHALARAYAQDDNTTRGKLGALIWASPGSGKTGCVAMVADAFWDVSSFKRIVLVTSPAALRANPPAAYHRYAALLPRFSGAPPDKIASAFAARGVVFTTFAKLAHATGVHRPSSTRVLQRTRTVYIVDEAHTMFRPLPTQRAEMRAVLRTLFSGASEDRFFFMTATPGESTAEVLAMLNMLRDPAVLPPLRAPRSAQEASVFVEQCRFMVSRYDAARDVHGLYPSVRFLNARLPMGQAQFARYREAIQKTAPADTDYDALKAAQKLERFYASARRFSNILYQVDASQPIAAASSKLPELVRRVAGTSHQKHFVYSSFGDRRGSYGQGIYAVAKALADAGYEELDPARAAALAKFSSSPEDLPMLRTPRFILVVPSSTESQLADLVSIFNSASNSRGEYVHVLLASGSFLESMDLKAVRHVHLLDPLLSAAAFEQAVGRAVRRCSHAQLPDRTHWTVTVHSYLAAAPHGNDEQTIDEHITRMVQMKHRPLHMMLTLLEMAAADCAAYAGHHGPVFCRRSLAKPMPPPSAGASA